MAAAERTTRLLLPPYGGRRVYPPAPTSRWYLPLPLPRRKPEVRGRRRCRLRGGECRAGRWRSRCLHRWGGRVRRFPRCSGPLRLAVAAVTRRHLRGGGAQPGQAAARALSVGVPRSPKTGPAVAEQPLPCPGGAGPALGGPPGALGPVSKRGHSTEGVTVPGDSLAGP